MFLIPFLKENFSDHLRTTFDCTENIYMPKNAVWKEIKHQTIEKNLQTNKSLKELMNVQNFKELMKRPTSGLFKIVLH